MKYTIIFLLLILTLPAVYGQETENKSSADEKLSQLFEMHHEYNMRTYPRWATYEGDHRYDDKLTDNSDLGVKISYDSTRMYLQMLEDIPYDELSTGNKLNYDLFKDELEDRIYAERFKFHYMPIGQQSGLHINFPQIINVQPLSTPEEYEKYFARLKGFSIQVDNVIENMRLGMAAGLMPPRFIMEQTLPQMEKIYIIDDPGSSVLYRSPYNIYASDEVRAQLDTKLKRLITEEVNASYKKLHDFVRDEYLPLTREEAGIWSLPDGKERYEYSVKNYTTTNLTADEVFNIGMSEVERIKSKMEGVKTEIGFEGTLDEFNNYLKTDSQFYYTNKEDLMGGFREILSRMDGKLTELFGRLPQANYDLREMEEFRAKSAPAAYYYSAPEDRSRPGYFYVNTYDLPSRPKYTMTALALHEAVPGHHLQISIAQELEGLPQFRKDLGVTAFIEGWGLYSEHLGYETGMYDDPYQRYGALTFEMWRACRLVVDAGIHSKKWTREEALEFLTSNTPGSDLDMASEIDRYISWPGQALAYKIGELKIKELRKKAEDRLGEKFDVRAFHDAVLGNGAIPLPLLEKNMNEWIESQIQ